MKVINETLFSTIKIHKIEQGLSRVVIEIINEECEIQKLLFF